MNMSDDDTSELIGMYQNGASAAKIIARFHIGYDTLYRILGRNGVAFRAAHRKRAQWDESKIKKAWDMYQSGLNVARVGQHFGVGRYAMARVLRNNGYTLKCGPRKANDGALNDTVITTREQTDTDPDADPLPPTWAIVAYRRRVAAGMPDDLARRISHLAHYNAGAVEAALQRVPLTM